MLQFCYRISFSISIYFYYISSVQIFIKAAELGLLTCKVGTDRPGRWMYSRVLALTFLYNASTLRDVLVFLKKLVANTLFAIFVAPSHPAHAVIQHCVKTCGSALKM